MSEYIVEGPVPYDEKCKGRIVRCRDCKYYNDPNEDDLQKYCTCLFGGSPIPRNCCIIVHPDGFCAWGIPKVID